MWKQKFFLKITRLFLIFRNWCRNISGFFHEVWVKRERKLITYSKTSKHTLSPSISIIGVGRSHNYEKIFCQWCCNKKSSHYINSNSSIFESFRVEFTLKSGSPGAPISFYFLEKSNFSLFFSHFFPNISRNPGRKNFVYGAIYIVHVPSNQLWVWWLGSSHLRKGGEKIFPRVLFFFVLDKVPLRDTQ